MKSILEFLLSQDNLKQHKEYYLALAWSQMYDLLSNLGEGILIEPFKYKPALFILTKSLVKKYHNLDKKHLFHAYEMPDQYKDDFESFEQDFTNGKIVVDVNYDFSANIIIDKTVVIKEIDYDKL